MKFNSKSNAAGEVALRVSKEAETAEATLLRFSVKDTGIGIPPEIQKNLFQVFTRPDASTTRKYGGAGLGLLISKELTELMDREIGLESEPGKGSTFWFTLPFEKKQGAAAAAPLTERPLRKYFRVLVAEDNIVNQKVALKQLEKLGCEADVAANGLEVLEALQRRSYDLVLMDCQMPEMDGFQAAIEIRKLEGDQQTHLPVVAMTANALHGDREKCLAAGMDSYIAKPLRLETLAETVDARDTPLCAATVKYLRELEGPDTPEFMSELLEAYLRDLPARLEAIRSAVLARDAKALQQAAHALKGSSANIGAQRLQKLCLMLEMTGRAESVDGAAELLGGLENEIASSTAALEALIRGVAKP